VARTIIQRLSKIYSGMVVFLGVVWRLANSPLSVAIVAGVILALIARSYTERDVAQKDMEARRDKVANALAELQQRVSYLQAAESIWKGRCDYPKVSEKEWEVITGTGGYIPTLPSYRGVHLTVVINDVERNLGVSDPRAGAVTFTGSFAVPPPRTAIFVHGQLGWLQKYDSDRSFLVGIGSLPIPRGGKLDDLAIRMLDIPGITPGADTRLRGENDKLANQVLGRLEKPEKALPPCKEPPTF
jgi:hypothetical protein